MTDYVLSALQINKEQVIEFNTFQLITEEGTFDHYLRFVDFIGKQAFIDNVFNVDKHGYDVMRWAFSKNKMNAIEYILSFDQIRKKYMSDNDQLHYLCKSMNQFIAKKECVKFVVDTLGLTEAKLNELNAFRAIDVEKIIPFTK